MDPRLVRRVAPVVYGLAILVCALFARNSLLVPVCVVGAILLGLMYVMLPRPSSGRVRERNRGRG